MSKLDCLCKNCYNKLKFFDIKVIGEITDTSLFCSICEINITDVIYLIQRDSITEDIFNLLCAIEFSNNNYLESDFFKLLIDKIVSKVI